MQQYEIIKLLGKGGEGEVYLARDCYLNRKVAIKKLRGIHGDVQKEAKILQRYSHPLLPIVYNCVYEEEWLLVMEYVEGISLTEYIRQKGYQNSHRVKKWAEELLTLLAFLHQQSTPVIYRDLKPDNILITPTGRIRVVDMGAILVRTFGTEAVSGSLAVSRGYAAPEQIKDIRSVDERSDIYAFGRVLYYMLTGADLTIPPYGNQPIRTFQPAVDIRLERIVSRCTKKNPDERFQTVDEIVRELQRKTVFRQTLRKYSTIRTVEKSLFLTEGQSCLYF